MSIKSSASIWLGKRIRKSLLNENEHAQVLQNEVLKNLLHTANNTAFGADHKFNSISNHAEWSEAVPVRDYEELVPYMERAKAGELSVLWPGMPKYFCKTSGTTSGTKFIPLTQASLPNHIGSARNALLNYIGETGQSKFVDGKMIFLQGSPELSRLDSGIPYGRLSGIVANHVPAYLQKNRMPSYATNCIEDWETKINRIVEETCKQDMRLISGIPSWVQMYFELLLEKTGKQTIKEIFPNFELFVFGGVNFAPYKSRFAELIGEEIPTIELYPASEGFLAYQDSQETEGLRLNINSGIYFEFIKAEVYFSENPKRYALHEVELGVNYALILSNNAGLWAYSIGDTVKFVSLNPYRILVTGRIKHFTSAFGEHVIGEEVDRAMTHALTQLNFSVNEFHVAPQVQPSEGLPYHEWIIEFNGEIPELNALQELLDNKMQEQNVYYKDLIVGSVLQKLKITPVKNGAFNAYMKSQGKLGGQNKIPRLANDRKLADALLQHK
ncbi:MAG: GH3 family domain-containing protein [Flavobacteriales bacterium]